jgi:transposase
MRQAMPEEHCEEKTRRWKDLPWADHRALIECTPIRVVCERCGATPQEALDRPVPA